MKRRLVWSINTSMGYSSYRRNRSTADAISLALHSTLEYLDNKDTYVRFLFIDYSSAFSTIIPTKLISKLYVLEIGSSLCDWILNFLTHRPQSVRIGNNTSSMIILNTGAPQGCVLSSLLYSLYTYDVGQISLQLDFQVC